MRTLVDPRAWLHLVRILHFYSYAHVRERAKLTIAPDADLAPNVSLRHAERIEIGARTHVGERAYLWAGKTTGRITLGARTTLAPEVFITAADYGLAPDRPILDQEMVEGVYPQHRVDQAAIPPVDLGTLGQSLREIRKIGL